MSPSTTYTYSAPQGSVLYTEVLSPYFYSYIVELYPRWLHPNILTVCGLISATAAMLLVATNSHELRSSADESTYLWAALGMFLYMVFDNTDGKQARRIGASSFVGEVLDHGVDMAVVTAGCIVVTDSLGGAIDSPFLAIMACFAFQIGQFINNWFHAVTGQMSWGGRYLSVDEAMVATVLVTLARGLDGDRWFLDQELFNLPPSTQEYAEKIGAWKPDGAVNVSMAINLTIIFFLLSDGVFKIYQTLKFAALKGTFISAAHKLAPFLLHSVLVLSLLPTINLETDLIPYCLMSGVSLAVVGCRLVFVSTAPTAGLQSAQDAVYISTVCLILISYVTKVLWPFNQPAEEQGFYSQYLLLAVLWAQFFGFFYLALLEINQSKGGGSMFTVKPKVA